MSLHLTYIKAVAGLTNDESQVGTAIDTATKLLTQHYDEIYEMGFETHMERDAYDKKEYRKIQKEIDDKLTDIIFEIHDIYEQANRYGITLHKHAIAIMQDRCTQDEDGNRNPHFDKCIVCDADIKAGIHS